MNRVLQHAAISGATLSKQEARQLARNIVERSRRCQLSFASCLDGRITSVLCGFKFDSSSRNEQITLAVPVGALEVLRKNPPGLDTVGAAVGALDPPFLSRLLGRAGYIPSSCSLLGKLVPATTIPIEHPDSFSSSENTASVALNVSSVVVVKSHASQSRSGGAVPDVVEISGGLRPLLEVAPDILCPSFDDVMQAINQVDSAALCRIAAKRLGRDDIVDALAVDVAAGSLSLVILSEEHGWVDLVVPLPRPASHVGEFLETVRRMHV